MRGVQICEGGSKSASGSKSAVTPADRAEVFIWRKVGPARRVTLPTQKGDPARRVTLLAEPTFCFPYKRPPSFVRKCVKSWLAQGSSGRRVTLLPETTFLHVNGALYLRFFTHELKIRKFWISCCGFVAATKHKVIEQSTLC